MGMREVDPVTAKTQIGAFSLKTAQYKSSNVLIVI
jgi:hypothetical protein